MNIAGPVTTFLPVSARSSQKSVVDQKDQVELRAVGTLPVVPPAVGIK